MRGSVVKTTRMPVMLADLLTPCGNPSGIEGCTINSVCLEIANEEKTDAKITGELIEIVFAIDPHLPQNGPTLFENAKRMQLKAKSKLNEVASPETVYDFTKCVSMDAMRRIPVETKQSFGIEMCKILKQILQYTIAGDYVDKVNEHAKSLPENPIGDEGLLYVYCYPKYAREGAGEIWMTRDEIIRQQKEPWLRRFVGGSLCLC